MSRITQRIINAKSNTVEKCKKKVYTRPVLTIYGTVTALTAGGSMGMAEAVSMGACKATQTTKVCMP